MRGIIEQLAFWLFAGHHSAMNRKAKDNLNLPDTSLPFMQRVMPRAVLPYIQLMRLDRPIGVWFSWIPSLWSLVVATMLLGQKDLPWVTAGIFAVGAVSMRAAACVLNDLIDRKIDRKVARTARRPLASGAISPRQAICLLVVLCLIGLWALLQFNEATIFWGLGSLVLVAVYPWLKRFTYWPQLGLGLMVNWGVLMGSTAILGEVTLPAVMLYVSGIFWAMGNDTIYALQDIADDLLVGVKSTAIRLRKHIHLWVLLFYAFAMAQLVFLGVHMQLSWIYFAGLIVPAGQLLWQVLTLDPEDNLNCLIRFRSNRWYAWFYLAVLLLEFYLSA